MFKKPLLIAEISGNHEGDFGKKKVNKDLKVGQFVLKEDINE